MQVLDGFKKWVFLLTEVEGKMDAVQYYEILDDEVLESFEKLEVKEEERIFQQGNDPKHYLVIVETNLSEWALEMRRKKDI